MDIDEFNKTQRSFYAVKPKFNQKLLNKYDGSTVPFVPLFDGKESEEAMYARWELYSQLHDSFQESVRAILDTVDEEVEKGVINALKDSTRKKGGRKCFRTLFLLGHESETTIKAPEGDSNTINALVEIYPKECPNTRMTMVRTLFRLATIISQKKSDEFEPGDDENIEEIAQSSDHLYDLSLLENFYGIYKKELNLIINFKETESFVLDILEDFIVLLHSALEFENVHISFIFNINTNISNFEQNLKRSTVRLLKKNVRIVDLSRTKGFKYYNLIFQSFLDCVDRKLNLSPPFVRFILDKMNNYTNQNFRFLIKILDCALMVYFFQNPYSIFIDVVNLNHLNELYLSGLSKCRTFLDFVEGMIRENASQEEVLSLLENKNNALEQLFADFLVAENPINDQLHNIINVLEEKIGIHDYNLIELYYHMLNDNIFEYLKRWDVCEPYRDELSFINTTIIFQEFFSLSNYNGLLSQELFPFYRSNLEDNLLNCERIFPPLGMVDSIKDTFEIELSNLIDPIICQIFKLYREANAQINVYDFYTAFKESLPKEQLYILLKDNLTSDNTRSTAESKVVKMLNQLDETAFMDRLSLVWFIQAVTSCQYLGIFRTHNYKTYETIEKMIWRGI